jgi:hypothetical protein
VWPLPACRPLWDLKREWRPSRDPMASNNRTMCGGGGGRTQPCVGPSRMELPNRRVHTTGKTGAVVRPIIAVRHRTAKTSLPCAERGTHGKQYTHGKVRAGRTAKFVCTANSPVPHGKVNVHGKVHQMRTAKNPGRQNQ